MVGFARSFFFNTHIFEVGFMFFYDVYVALSIFNLGLE